MANQINLPEENIDFKLKDFPIEHQGQAVIDLSVDLDYKEGINNSEYPDFTPIGESIINFLVEYPNETDFWEILNKNLVTQLLTEPIAVDDGTEYNLDEILDSLTVDIDIQPGSANIPTPRSSMVLGTIENEEINFNESFSFEIVDYEIEHQGQSVIDLSVDLDYKEGIGKDNPLEYPDFVPIRDFIDNFLINYPNETDFWEVLNKNLADSLLTEAIPTPFGIEYNLDEVLDAITVDIDVESNLPNLDISFGSTVTQTVDRSEPVTDKPLPKTVFGSSEADSFDTTISDEKQFLGENQILFAGAGNDNVDITFAPGGESSRVDLGSGDDVLFGGSKHQIIAGSGNDILFLGSGEGNNIVSGGSGSDQFWLVTDILDLPSKENTITDFIKNEDVIGFANTTLEFDDLKLTQDGSNTIINALGQDLTILLDTQVNDLSASDFAFV
ncbi:hypothetical protein NIES267_08870 [Calothrix parasitica NIES-267]|uniref:Hemolysin-type calcium-binding region n=1 Tax=Calothrix parasitica NIES-267 TaxID=1973488 RepID=A0A1Z4LJL2_9CYAN|nr:hypothetical protein NIES267_08870 [Calothrix parasitica NIES-267]